MTSCNHHPAFHFKILISRDNKYICKECGATIEFSPRFKLISRIINGLTIAAMVYLALNNSIGDVGKPYGLNSITTYFIIMGLVILLYIILMIILMKFGKFVEIEPADQTDISTNPANATDTTNVADTTNAADASEIQSESTSQYTEEQLELMALYDSYVQKNAEAGEDDPGNTFSDADTESIVEPQADVCEHTPKKVWKNYIPGVYDFRCEHCGKLITFTPAVKKRLNLILLAFSSIILITSFSNMSMPFWQLILISIGVLIVCSFVQYFFVKN